HGWFLRASAIRMTFQTLLAEVIHSGGFRRHRVRIVTGATPQAVTAPEFATAVGKLFKMAGDPVVRRARRTDTYPAIITHEIARPEGTKVASRFLDSSDSGEVAARQNAVPRFGGQFCRVNDRVAINSAAGFTDVLVAIAVTHFAADATLEKRRGFEAVLGP